MKNTILLATSIAEYWWRFFGSRRFPENQEFYVVYTSLDHSIPLRLDSAANYWLINLKFLPTSIRLSRTLPEERFSSIRGAYREIVGQGVAAFRKVPTIMPHFAGSDSAAARLARTLMKPINCSPSLHTAAPLFLYNLGAEYFPETEPSLRRHIGDILSTIVKTKFHALVDIAFGMFLTRRIVEDKLGLHFRNLEAFLVQEQKGRDQIPYEHIFGMYDEINELGKTKMGMGTALPEIMESYFQEIGLPRVKRPESNCYYDLDQKALAYPPELIVGKGLL